MAFVERLSSFGTVEFGPEKLEPSGSQGNKTKLDLNPIQPKIPKNLKTPNIPYKPWTLDLRRPNSRQLRKADLSLSEAPPKCSV